MWSSRPCRTIRQLEADRCWSARRAGAPDPGRAGVLEEARRVLLTLSKPRPRRGRWRRDTGAPCVSPCRRRRADRLSALLALCREEAPEVGIRLFEAPLSQVVGGLGNDLYDAAFAMAGEMEAGVIAMPVWQDPLVVAIPARHLCWRTSGCRWKRWWLPAGAVPPAGVEECSRQCERLLRLGWRHRRSWPSTTTHSLMLALVAAGYGVGIFHRGARGGMPAGGRDRPAAG